MHHSNLITEHIVSCVSFYAWVYNDFLFLSLTSLFLFPCVSWPVLFLLMQSIINEGQEYALYLSLQSDGDIKVLAWLWEA